mmetsp:Transcript_86998/g.172699  ORF Transcript_86998/g.172699 Transcript_86998/m.172699 type:complete len:620 (-) Transcript_86998:99-1958(-)
MEIIAPAALLPPNFVIVVLASTCVVAGAARVDSCCKTEQCHPNCAAPAGILKRAWLPTQPRVRSRNVQTMSLFQTRTHSARVNDDTEEEHQNKNEKDKKKEAREEETILEMGEGEGQHRNLEVGSWKARPSHAVLSNLSADKGRTASGAATAHPMAAFKMNRTAGIDSDDKTGIGLQPASRRQISREEDTILEMGKREGQPRNLEVGSWKTSTSHAVLSNQSADNNRTASDAATARATAAFKLNRAAGIDSDDKTGISLQPASQRQFSSSGLDFDANRATASAPFASNGTWHNALTTLHQLVASLHSGLALARQNDAAASRWVLATALLAVAMVVCVCFGGHKFCLGANGSGTAAWSQADIRARAARMARARESMVRPGSMRHLSDGTRRGSISSPSPSARICAGPTDGWLTQESLLGLMAVPPPPQQSSYEDVSCLCVSLVVPPQCESLLYVPMKPKKSFHAVDKHGNRLIGVELITGVQRGVELVAPTGSPIAVCKRAAVCEHAPEPVCGELFLMDGNGEYFATIVPGGADGKQSFAGPRVAWIVRASCGSEWLFRGDFDSFTVQVTDRQNRMLAITQPTDPVEEHSHIDKMYMLRVAGMMDISIVLCTILAVQHLQ